MNNWSSDPFQYPEKPLDRGKVLTADELDRLGEFSRYKDIDGDGIPYRTLPGTDHPLAAYFTRGSGHDETAGYSEKPEDYEGLMNRLARKKETARDLLPSPVVEYENGAEVGLISYGSTDVAMDECRNQLRNEHNVLTHYFRLRALPFSQELHDFFSICERVYVVEQNKDGQMANMIKMELEEGHGKIRKILHFKGLPIDARFITDELVSQEKEK